MIDLPTLQAYIADIQQVVDQIDQLIPGDLGNKIRAVVGVVEQLSENPVLQSLLLILLQRLGPGATAQDMKNLVHGLDVQMLEGK